MTANIKLAYGNTSLNVLPQLGGSNDSLLMYLSCISNNQTIVKHSIVYKDLNANGYYTDLAAGAAANAANLAPKPGLPGWGYIDYSCLPENVGNTNNGGPPTGGRTGDISVSGWDNGTPYRTANLETDFTFVYNPIANYQVNIEGGNKLTTYFDHNNDTKIVNITFRNVKSPQTAVPQYAEWDIYQQYPYGYIIYDTPDVDVNCSNIVIITGNTIWDYAERTNIDAQLYTQTYNDGAEIVTISSGSVTLNLGNAHTFFIQPGAFSVGYPNHTISTINIIEPVKPEKLSFNFSMILANVRSVSTAAWRNAGIRWPKGVAPVSVHKIDGSGPCGKIDIYSFLNFNNLDDVPSQTNSYSLLINGNAEMGNIYKWTTNSNFAAIASNTIIYDQNDQPRGNYTFLVATANKNYAYAWQDINISNTTLVADISTGRATANLHYAVKGNTLAPFYTWDRGTVALKFYNSSNTLISATNPSFSFYGSSTFQDYNANTTIPAATRNIRVELQSLPGGFSNPLQAGLEVYFDDISLNVNKLWDDRLSAPRGAANTTQNNIWYGFNPYVRKIYSKSNETNFAVLFSSQPKTETKMIRWEWERYRTHWPSRIIHIICVNNTGLLSPTYSDFNLPDNLFNIPYGIQPKVYFTNADNGNVNLASDWFALSGLAQTDACSGTIVKMFSRRPGQCSGYGLFTLNNLECSSAGASYIKFRTNCSLYNIRLFGGVVPGPNGSESNWITPLDYDPVGGGFVT